MKKLEEKIKERMANCPGVIDVEFETVLHVDILVSRNKWQFRNELYKAEMELREKYPGMLMEFRFLISDKKKKGE
jgi:hypothetical protein